jgi:8-oxo-dGTP pyrophosphatase MutT (NUDIX family)
MIIKINKEPVFKLKEPLEINKTSEEERKIKEVWDNFIKDNSSCFDGDIYVVTNVDKNNEDYIFEIGKTKFKDLIYAKTNKNYEIHSLFSGIILKTEDNYFLLIKNKQNTINAIGGMASTEDFINKKFSSKKCLERELKEELGLTLDNKNDILNYNLSYIRLSNDEKAYPYGIIYTGVLNYEKDELLAHFDKNKNKLDDEIKELLFYTNDTYKELYDISNKKDYLTEVIEDIENN